MIGYPSLTPIFGLGKDRRRCTGTRQTVASPAWRVHRRMRGDSPALLFCRCRRSILVKDVCNSLPSAVGRLLEDGDVLAVHCTHLLGLGVCEGHGVGTLTVAKVARLRSIHFVRRNGVGEVLVCKEWVKSRLDCCDAVDYRGIRKENRCIVGIKCCELIYILGGERLCGRNLSASHLRLQFDHRFSEANSRRALSRRPTSSSVL